MSARPRSLRPEVESIEGRVLLATLTPVRPSSPVLASAPVDPGIENVTDPSLIKQGATYYVFSSGPGIDIRTSTDLTHWQVAGHVFDSIPRWALEKVPGASSIWAPDVSYFAGLYHVYYAVSTFGSQRSVIGLATSPTLDPRSAGYHWQDRGLVVESRPGRDNFNAIDPNVVTDPAGNVWLTFGSQWSGIKQARIDPLTGSLAPTNGSGLRGRTAPRFHFTSLAFRPSAGLIEAPFVFQHGGQYYLFVSFGACCRGVNSTYQIMVGRSSSPNGPFLDHSGRPMVHGGGSLVLAGSGRWRGPGSSSVLADGSRDWLVFHAYDAMNSGLPTLQVRPLSWTPDGWPVVRDPLTV